MNNGLKRSIGLKFFLMSSIALVGQLDTINLHAQGRPIKFEHLGLEQGLSQSSVYCILQDHQGFMWFGTQAGLNKFDGYGFTSYQQDVFDSTSIATNVVRAIYEDQTGTLWAGDPNAACLNRFERETERFTRFVHDPKNSHSLSDGGVLAIYEDHTGTLWVGTSNGLNKFDREKEQFTRYLYNPKYVNSLHGYSVYSIYEDRNSTIWIGTERWLNKFVREKEQFVFYAHDPQTPLDRSAKPITAIFEDRAGTLWIGSEGAGLKKFDRETGQFTAFVHDPENPRSLGSDSVSTIYEDRSGTLWIGTWGGGLNRFDRDQKQFTRFVHDPPNPHSLSDNNVCSIYEDRPGILWIGVFTFGLNKFDPAKERFTQFVNDPNDPYSLSNNTVGAIYRDHTGTLWFRTEGGLERFDNNTKHFTQFFHDPKNPHSLSPTFNHSYIIYEDHAGTLWIGTWGGGLNKFDRDKEQFTRFVHDPQSPNSLSTNTISAIYEDRSGTLWIGTYGGGLNKFDRDKEQFKHFFNDPTNPHSLRDNLVWAICEDQVGALWIGTKGGLSRLSPNDRAQEQFTHFVHNPNNPRSLSDNYILSLCVDHTGMLWVGTWSGGLNRFDRENEQFTHFMTKDGLPDNNIEGILDDDHGRLWLSTGKGLSCFDPKSETAHNYDVTDGLPSNEFYATAYRKSYRGELFFRSFNGPVAFHPDSIKDNPHVPPIAITAFKRYNTDDAKGLAIEEKGISAKKGISVSYKDNVLAFEFAALSYRNTFKNQYAYKLEGFNDNWIQLGNKREVTFTNLDPGEYTLRVKGSNNDGVWNEEGTSLKITITPPWWRTRLAYAFYVLLFMASLYGWRRFELNRVKLRNELQMQKFEAQKLHEMDQMKSRFFANISHEFRTPLTLILGPVEQMRGKAFKGNLDEAYDMILRNGRRLLRLINQLLDLARIEAGRLSLQARPENIVSFLKGLVLSFASAAERQRIKLSITAEEENLSVYFDRDKLEKIVSNLLSNALKFTPEEGRVSVQLSVSSDQLPSKRLPTDHWLLITVTDTGPGIPVDQRDKIFDRFYQVASHTSTGSVQEHEGTGIGLALTKELVELHHGEILVQSEVGRGTTFIVRLPLGKAHLKPEEIASEQSSMVEHRGWKVDDRELKIEDRFSIEAHATSNKDQASSDEQPVTSDENIVLIVEDNHDVYAYIRQYLEPAFRIVEAHDGVAGVEKALEIIPDLIISDVMMPKRDGNELCRILKADERTSHVPIIMLTAKADRDSKVQGLETGADDYLVKPFDSKELLARVHNLIKLRRQLRERFSREIVLKPQDIAITPMDEVFLNKVKAVVEKHLGDEDFDVEIFRREVGMSHTQIHRKLKALTNQSASQFIRSLRLQRAVELLKQNAGTVAEIAYQVGFGSQAYFTKCFHQQFGCTPKEYVRQSI